MSLGVTHTVPLQVIPFAVVAELPSNTFWPQWMTEIPCYMLVGTNITRDIGIALFISAIPLLLITAIHNTINSIYMQHSVNVKHQGGSMHAQITRLLIT